MKKKKKIFLDSPINPARPLHGKRLSTLFFTAWGMM